MLFISEEPIKVKITEDRQVIILTQTKLKISHLDFIEQFSSINLVGGKPQNFHYSEESSEVMVQTTNTLELYSWKFKGLKLTKVIVLNNEPVYSIYYQPETGWNVIGDILQYEQPKVVYHSVKEYFTQKNPTCFVGRNQYTISGSKMYKSENKLTPREVEWKDLIMIIKNFKNDLQITGGVGDQMRDFICVGQRYLGVVEKYQVIQTIERDRIFYFENSLVISESVDSEFISFDKFQKRNLIGIGTIPSFPGKICASKICETELIALYYKSKELKIKSIPLIQENDQQHGKGGKKKLENSISRIIQRSHEGGSLLSSPEFENQSSNFKASSKRPIIRDIQEVEGQNELNREFFNSQSSEVLSRSGLQQKSIEKVNQIDAAGFGKVKSEEGNLRYEQQQEFDKTKSKSISKLRVKKRYSDAYRMVEKQIGSENNFSNGTSQDIVTPAFGAFGFQSQWDDQKFIKHEVKKIVQDELEQSLALKDDEDSLNNIAKAQNSKTKLFKPQGSRLKQGEAESIEKTSYIDLMEELYKRNIDRFQQILKSQLWQIVNQKNSPRFFSQHIRAFSSQSTQDKIRKLFQPYINRPNSKEKITAVLKQFKFNEVPADYIALPTSVIEIILLVCPDLYLEDILQPEGSTLEMFLETYLMQLPISHESIMIEDEQISISHPRNILNIILYLNESLDLPLDLVLDIFCKKMIKYNHVQVIKKVLEEDIFGICGVDRKILDDTLCRRFYELLRQSLENADCLWDLVQLMNPKIKEQYEMKLAVIQQFNENNVTFDLEQLIAIRNLNADIYLFLDEIITKNKEQNLCELKLGSVYQSLFWLQENEKISNCTNEYLELVKEFSQKLMGGGYVYHSMINLFTITEKVRKSFVAKLLLLYAKGKLINRLVSSHDSYILMFEDIIRNPNLMNSDLQHQDFEIPDSSPFFECSWEQFCDVIEMCIPNQPQQLQLLLYKDIHTGQQLFLTLSENMKYQFNLFIHQMRGFLKRQLNDEILDDDSLNPKAMTNIKIITLDEVVESVMNASSQQDRQAYLLEQPESDKVKNTSKSMNLIDHFNNIKNRERANSQEKKKQDILPYDQLYHLKILVNQSQILDILKDLYERGDRKKFIQALTMIDLEKVTLYHLDIYKALKDLEYDFEQVIPFNLFTTAQISSFYKEVQAYLKPKLCINNFWFFCSFVELIFGKSKNLQLLFLQKIVFEYESDQYAQILGLILNQVKPLRHSDKMELVNTAQRKNLKHIIKQLKQI